MTIPATDGELLAALHRDWRHQYRIGHDSDGTWWAVRHDASIAPLESCTAAGLRVLIEADAACSR